MVFIFETGLWQKQIFRRYLCTHLMIDFIYHMMCNFVLCRKQTCLSLSVRSCHFSLSHSFIFTVRPPFAFRFVFVPIFFFTSLRPVHLSGEESPVSQFFFSYIFFCSALSFLCLRSCNLSLVCSIAKYVSKFSTMFRWSHRSLLNG